MRSKSFLNPFLVLDFEKDKKKIRLQQLIILPPKIYALEKSTPVPRNFARLLRHADTAFHAYRSVNLKVEGCEKE